MVVIKCSISYLRVQGNILKRGLFARNCSSKGRSLTRVLAMVKNLPLSAQNNGAE